MGHNLKRNQRRPNDCDNSRNISCDFAGCDVCCIHFALFLAFVTKKKKLIDSASKQMFVATKTIKILKFPSRENQQLYGV